jgi:hypothetical protein
VLRLGSGPKPIQAFLLRWQSAGKDPAELIRASEEKSAQAEAKAAKNAAAQELEPPKKQQKLEGGSIPPNVPEAGYGMYVPSFMFFLHLFLISGSRIRMDYSTNSDDASVWLFPEPFCGKPACQFIDTAPGICLRRFLHVSQGTRRAQR